MTTREIVATFKEMYDADVSSTLISKFIDAVKEQVTECKTDNLMRCIALFTWTGKVFPTYNSMQKIIYLAIGNASKKWSMPIQNWRLVISRFISLSVHL